MSDSNNNLDIRDISRRWENNANSYQIQSAGVELEMNLDQDLILETYTESVIDVERNCNLNSPSASAGSLEALQEEDAALEEQVNVALSPWPPVSQSNWQMEGSPAPSLLEDNNPALDEEEFESESESELEFLFEEAPPIHGIRFYNPNFQPPAVAAQATDVNANATGNATALPNISQINNPRLNLRPVPASIDLTRNRPPSTWRDYHARVRTSSGRLHCPEAQSRPAANGIQRLCAGQPPNQVPMYMDDEIGAFVFFRNDTDSEEEPPLPPLAMVPRRGNSVSDLSQCSSDDEPNPK